MPKKRPIPKVDLAPYLVEDTLLVKPWGDKDLRMEFGGDRCRTAVLDEAAALEVILSLVKQGKKVWNQQFVLKVLTHVEVV